MAEQKEKKSLNLTSSSINEQIDSSIQDKKNRVLEIEKEQNKLNKSLSEVLEKIADTKFKVADKMESLLEETFIELVSKNKIYSELVKKIDSLKSSDKISDEKLKNLELKLEEVKKDRMLVQERNDKIRKSIMKFKKEANKAYEKSKEYLLS